MVELASVQLQKAVIEPSCLFSHLQFFSGSDPNALFSAPKWFGTTQWNTSACDAVIVGAQRYAIGVCLPRPTAEAPFPTASWKWNSCTDVEMFSDQACQDSVASTTSTGTAPPGQCDPRNACCSYGNNVFLNAQCHGAARKGSLLQEKKNRK